MPETREDRLVAAISHASVLLPIIGTLIPLITWISQRERSPLIRSQGLQALIYQCAGTVAYFLVNFCMMGSMFLVFPLSMLAVWGEPGSGAPPDFSSPGIALAFLIMIFASILMPALLFIAGPIYMLIGLIAAWRVLAGSSFHYPLVGWLASRGAGGV